MITIDEAIELYLLPAKDLPVDALLEQHKRFMAGVKNFIELMEKE